MLQASLQHDPCIEGADQSSSTYANAMQAWFSAFTSSAWSAIKIYWLHDIYVPEYC